MHHSHSAETTVLHLPALGRSPRQIKMADFPVSLDVPSQNAQVYKDECVLCFKDAEDGLHVDMRSFMGYCGDHRPTSSDDLYLGVKATRVDRPKGEKADDVPDKLAIGVEGGFQVDERDYDLIYSYWIERRGDRVELDSPSVPGNVKAVAEAIKGHDGARTTQQVKEVWEEQRQVSTYALGMVQEPANGKRVSSDPSVWRCDETGGDGGGSLWLNLHDGFIGGGRPQWDGSGGNGAAMRHYQAMKAQGKKYPLVVKLGTITPAGADVYSYASDEDDMVLDPDLGEHLAHWGISMMTSAKTTKSMAELQIDKNVNFEFDLITEAGKGLEIVEARPGLVGLKNLGNSCYLNSVLQVLVDHCDIEVGRDVSGAGDSGSSAPCHVLSLKRQYMKVRDALLRLEGTGVNSTQAVTPWMFKRACGAENSLWASGAQQDAHEYMGFLLEALGLEKDFEVGIRTRVTCPESGRVSQSVVNSLGLGLDIFNCTKNKRMREADGSTGEGGDGGCDVGGHSKLTLEECLQWNYGREELIEGYYSAFLKKRVAGIKTSRMTSFPKVLIVHLRRYYVDEDWTPKKLQVEIEVPDTLNLSAFKVPDEEPEVPMQPNATQAADEKPVDAGHLDTLMGMGFAAEDAEYSLREHDNDVERAMEFLLSGGKAVPKPGTATSVSPESVAMITSMGFSDDHARLALSKTNGNVEASLDLLLSGAPLVPEDGDGSAVPDTAAAPAERASPSSSTTYRLAGFLSHIGPNLSSGHYVAHVRKEGEWFLCNDEKLAKSQALPKQLSYVLVYIQE